MEDNDKKSGLKGFFSKNRSLMFTLPVLIILIVLVVLLYVLGGSGGKDTADDNPPVETDDSQTRTPGPTQTPGESDDSEGIVTLPDNEREKDPSEILRNPMAGPYRVSGIIYDEKDGSLAIIEAENKSFILKAGESAGSYFKVMEIKENEVVLDVDGMEIVLALSGN
jgi:hypothetical protein